MKNFPKYVFFFAALAVSGHCLSQTAESVTDKRIEQKFKAADTNHDGKLTLQEAKDGMPKVAANFRKIDTEARGYVTIEQIKAAANK